MDWKPISKHDRANALNAALLARAAYGEPEDADIRFHDDVTGAVAYGWATQHQIVIAFKGTSSAGDVRTDLKFHKVPFTTAAESGTSAFTVADIKRAHHGHVHRGFLAAVGGVWASVRDWLRNNRTNQPVFLTGHSLGAANACVLALRLVAADIPVTAVYTFGCPRVGNGKFARLFNELIRHYRYVNHNDAVTRLPPVWLGGRHTGFEYYFNRRGERVVLGVWGKFWDRLAGRLFQSVVDGLHDHSMSEYLERVERTRK